MDEKMVEQMRETAILKLNFDEIRRRSIKVWEGIPQEFLGWKPDSNAMNCLEMVRHVLEGQYIYHIMVKNGGELDDFQSPWKDRSYTTLQDELDFSEPFRLAFFETLSKFSISDLTNKEIIRPEKNQRRKLGDYLLRIAYHEAIHTGQMLAYLRSLGVERPDIWD